MLNNVLLIIFGWFLGLFSPLIVDWLRKWRENRTLKSALFTELREARCRLLLLVYRVESSYGELNHEFFEWAQSILTEYEGIHNIKSLLDTIGPLLKLSPEEMKVYSQYAKQKKQLNSVLSLKKYSLSFLDSSLPSLAKFDAILQSQLLEIKTRIGFMNELVDEARYYFRLSFQNDISSRNYEIANIHTTDCYRIYASQARDVIKIIGEILAQKI